MKLKEKKQGLPKLKMLLLSQWSYLLLFFGLADNSVKTWKDVYQERNSIAG
jgi:hypothetical protein